MAKTTLVKTKIVHETNQNGEQSLTAYFWKQDNWWSPGYWYPFGTSCGGTYEDLIQNISDASVSQVIFEEFISPRNKK